MTTQREMTETTKAKLRQAAIDSICELGYDRTTGVEIARRAGMTRGALHHHYPRGKVDLFLDVIHTGFTDADDKYQGQPISYSDWFASRIRYFEHTDHNENIMREFWAMLNIMMFVDVGDEEGKELHHAYESRYARSLELRDELVNATEEEKATVRPIYQFLHVLFTGYLIHQNRLKGLGHAEGAIQFAKQLLETWKRKP